MELSLAELRLLIEALGTLMAEYDETPERLTLDARLREARRRREDDS